MSIAHEALKTVERHASKNREFYLHFISFLLHPTNLNAPYFVSRLANGELDRPSALYPRGLFHPSMTRAWRASTHGITNQILKKQ